MVSVEVLSRFWILSTRSKAVVSVLSPQRTNATVDGRDGLFESGEVHPR